MKRSRRNHPKPKKGAWFIPVRGSYLPASTAGWITYIPFTAYLIFTFVVGWRDASSHSMAVLFIVPNWVAASVAMTYLASRKS